ncbi:F-box only protein 16-like [Mya arenaria]|uniref:F-box only protein 16-like n=1 Tax=Mya arenaria TaxID=6604 RepID=UPI0022E69502|nr:F-box only protein 16-like [Mya arenaria]
MSMIAKNRTKSTWTPLSNEETNNQIFEERRVLINKWFDKWTHDQRKHIMEDLIHKAKIREKGFIRDYVKEHVPALKRDFTRHLPRVISIYIFSFLDPRSLCRAGQVCWYWKYLTDLDQLWMLKCVKLGWNLPVMPGQYETGVWKRNYVENIKTLQIMFPKKSTKIDLSKIVPQQKPPKSAKSGKSTPWRGSDPVPKDTWRYNYLENNDVVQDVKTMRRRKDYAPEGKEVSRHSRSKVKTGQNIHNTEVRRSQSYTKIVTTSQDHLNNWDGFTMSMTMPPDASMGVTRPAPVHSHPRPTKRQQVSARTPRDPPSTDLFPKQPWKVGNKEESDEEL